MTRLNKEMAPGIIYVRKENTSIQLNNKNINEGQIHNL